MLSRRFTREAKIISICEKSGGFDVGREFIGVRVADEDDFMDIEESSISRARTVYCGKVDSDELLFRTADGRYYFTLCDGWGEKDGILYGMTLGFIFDFKHPTSPETIVSECRNAIGTSSYGTWGGAMAFGAKKCRLELIERVIKKYGVK